MRSILNRREFLKLAGLSLLGGAIAGHQEINLVSRWRASKVPGAAPGSPNVLLIVLDTVRAQNMSLCGYHRRTTPHLEELAEGGIVFERAISTAPWTLPSHASMFTGRYPHELSADWSSPLDSTYPSLAEALLAQGYHTGGFVANTVYCSREHGLHRGFVHYEDYEVSGAELLVSSTLARTIANSRAVRQLTGYHDILTRKSAHEITESFLRWQSELDRRPFFAFLNYFDSHEPYLPPAPYDHQFGDGKPRDHSSVDHDLRNAQDWERGEKPDLQIQAELDAYDGAIAYQDAEIERLVKALDASGDLDNTILIITSDHGEHFGEHNLFSHGNSLYRQLLHVPLLIRFPPQVPGGRRLYRPVSLLSLPSTVMDLAGGRNASGFPGESLKRLWEMPDHGTEIGSEPILSEVTGIPNHIARYPIAKGDMKSLVYGGYHYIKNGDGSEELYDFERDSFEKQDLIGTRQGDRLVGRFRDLLASAVRRG